MRPLPAIVISGFLGAGKTTLLNRMLADGLSGKRAGVIVNDFGKINVDGRLVSAGAHPLLELANGCVCCTLQMGLSQAVRTLAARDELGLLLVEASGISVSSALLQTLKAPDLADSLSVSKVIAVIDARRYTQVLHALPVIRDQVAHANLIVLNHCDEVDPATIDASRDRLRQDNPDAPIVVSEHGNVALDELMRETIPTEPPARRTGHDEHWHAYEVVLPDDADPGHVRALADQLPDAVERVKGFVSRGDEMHVVQKVGPFPATVERRAEGAGNDARNVLVVIARAPVEAELRHIFAGCTVTASTATPPAPHR